MTRASKWLRRIEITLWVFGLSMLGVSVGATVDRWQYQAQQDRVLLAAMDAGKGVAGPVAPSSPVSFATEGSQHPVQTEQYDTAIGPERPVVVGALDLPEAKPAEKIEPAAAVPQRLKREEQRETDALSGFGRIEIPRLGVSAIVREGVDETTLARAVGLVPGTAKPGEAGNVVLAGHRDTFFRPLRRIEVDDTIRLVVPPHTYEYRVESLNVVTPADVSVMDSRGVDELTLVTCHPFRYIGPAPDRFIVRAARVN